MSLYRRLHTAMIQHLFDEYMGFGTAARIADQVLAEALEFDVVRLEHSMKDLRVHLPTKCQGRPCTVHNRTDHPSRHMMQVWDDRWGTMRRMCEHFGEHPDYDERVFHNTDELSAPRAQRAREHDCDGCCKTKGEEH